MEHKGTPTRVLLIEDDEEDYIIVRNLFRKMSRGAFTLEWTANFEEASRIILQKVHDIYLVDYRLGAQTGLELLQLVDLAQRVEPFIVLTGAGDEEIERSAMEQGVADYLVKGRFDAELLARVMLYSLQRKQSEMQRIDHLLELNKSKDEFIALASHQLRTPATAVKQYIGMILQGYAGDVSEDHRTLLTHAFDSNERQIQIVEDLLRTARLDLQKVELRKRKVDVAELVARAVADIATVLENRHQSITYTKPKKPVWAELDNTYVAMSVGNLLDNASKYTPPGKNIFISIEQLAPQSAPNGKQLAISIRDEGVGIGNEDAEKLFKKFSRIYNPLSIEVGGTGLGLYWAQKIVQLHDGDITFTSQLGVGTTFVITLPIR